MSIFSKSKNVLVVAAHPDDEVLGCGATVAKLAAQGCRVRTLILATGSLSRDDGSAQNVKALERTAQTAAKILGVEHISFAAFPDNAMDTVPLLEVVKRIEQETIEFQPDTVFTHHAGDLNIDHRIAHEAVLTACRPLPGASVKTIACFETPSSTEWQSIATPVFHPTLFVDCSDGMDLKRKAIDCYEMEMRPSPHARSVEQVEDIARVRGRSVGLATAEAFVLTRHKS